MTETIVHLAGPYYPDTGQHCLVCGKVLTRAEGDVDRQWIEGEDGAFPRGWSEGALVQDTQTGVMIDVSNIEDWEGRRCVSSDYESDEDDE